MNLKSINSVNNSSNKGKLNSNVNSPKIKRRNFFVYLGSGLLGAYALTKLPFRLFQQKLKAETSIKVKANPYSVKRNMIKTGKDTKGSVNG